MVMGSPMSLESGTPSMNDFSALVAFPMELAGSRKFHCLVYSSVRLLITNSLTMQSIPHNKGLGSCCGYFPTPPNFVLEIN